jgi:hypothetical protein
MLFADCSANATNDVVYFDYTKKEKKEKVEKKKKSRLYFE